MSEIIRVGELDIHIHVNAALSDEQVIILYSDEFRRAMGQHILNKGYKVSTLPPGWDAEKIRQHVHIIRVKDGD